MRSSLLILRAAISLKFSFSLNHQSFIGEGNNFEPLEEPPVAAPAISPASVSLPSPSTATFATTSSFFDVDFFVPVQTPTVKPGIPPTLEPVPAGHFLHPTSNTHINLKPPTFKSTSAPIPAGRFSQPTSNPPTFKPTLAPVPVGHFHAKSNHHHPIPKPPTFLHHNNYHPQPIPNRHTLKPTLAPVPADHFLPTSTYHPTVPKPSTIPHHYNHPHTQHTQPSVVPVSEVEVDTRTASYTSEWGTSVNKCQQTSTKVFFSCNEGGMINVAEVKNAICGNTSNDQVQCQQDDVRFDSSITFACSGISRVHLLASANVSSSLALYCEKDGNAVKYITLSRYCVDDLGRTYIDTSADCVKGISWQQEESSFCASPAVCTIQDGCRELEIESIEVSNKNEDVQCGLVDLRVTQDLQYARIETTPSSLLSSINRVDWRISGQGRGCLWESSPLFLKCDDGGNLEFLEHYPRCSMIPEDNMAICESFASFSTKSEESISMLVSCTGRNEKQLLLSVEIPSEPLDVQCEAEGTAIQTVMLSRQCGEFGTEKFAFINDKSFCDFPEQIFEVDDERNFCFVGDRCELENGCSNMQFPSVTANTGSLNAENCIYIL